MSLPVSHPAVISPSLSRLYREELIAHVVGWPAEAVEKTCQRVNEDHQNIISLAGTRVSAELKMARSLVRLADIQATLQEQRIMFLRQQTADLESHRTDVRPSRDVPRGTAASSSLAAAAAASSSSSDPSPGVYATTSAADPLPPHSGQKNVTTVRHTPLSDYHQSHHHSHHSSSNGTATPAPLAAASANNSVSSVVR